MNSSQLPPCPLSSTSLTCPLIGSAGSAIFAKVAEHDPKHRRGVRSDILDKTVEHELQHGPPVLGSDMDRKRLRKLVDHQLIS